jgi:chromate transporter
VLARRSITDIPTVLPAALTIGVLVKFKKIPEPVIVLVAALVGLMTNPPVKR